MMKSSIASPKFVETEKKTAAILFFVYFLNGQLQIFKVA